MAREATNICLRVLKESNKSRFDSYSVRNKCIDHIPYYLSGLSRAQFFATTFLDIAVSQVACYKYVCFQKAKTCLRIN